MFRRCFINVSSPLYLICYVLQIYAVSITIRIVVSEAMIAFEILVLFFLVSVLWVFSHYAKFYAVWIHVHCFDMEV